MALSNSLITSWTSANETTGTIGGASECTGTPYASSAHLNAHLHFRVELVAIGTTALEATNCVDAGIVSTGGRVALVLVDALIVIEMLNESVGTTATIASHIVLTSVFTRCVISALVLIDAISVRLVQLESSRADAPETAQSVDASTRFRTSSVLFTLVYVVTGVTVLIVTLLATASVAALGINAVLLAQVISSCAFVQISAADTIRI